MSILLRSSEFEDPYCDPVKQVKTAANFKKWGGWSSGMHALTDKARMKDVSVLLILLFQTILKDKTSLYPLVMLSNFAHAVSGVLLFLLAKKFFGIEASIILYLIYIFSFWPYMIILHGGLHIIAQMFFLLALYFLFFDIENNIYIEFFFYFLSGAFFAAMNFTSSSAEKYILPYFLGLVYVLSDRSLNPWLSLDNDLIFLVGNWVIIFSLIIIFISISLLIFFRKRLVTFVYNSNFGFFFFRKKDKIELKYYLNRAKVVIKELGRYSCALSSYLVVILFFVHDNTSYLKLFFLTLGFFISVIYFLSPKIRLNLSWYYIYSMGESQLYRDNPGRFSLYKEYFLKNYGKTFESGEEGHLMYFKIYFRIVPIQTILFIFSLIFLFYQTFIFQNLNTSTFFLILLVSFSSILWNEYTMGPKSILPFYTTYIPLFFPIGLSLNILFNEKIAFITDVNYILIIFILFIFWNLYYFFTDIFPSKMCINKIINTLKKNNISEFYTYNNDVLNAAYLKVITWRHKDVFKIKYIKSISELSEGIVLIPCLSSKGCQHESSPMGRTGDFKEDLMLNDLITSKKIEDITIGKFKTLSSSPFWQLTMNVPAFRDLILKEVDNEQRYLGHAWLIDVSKLKKSNTIL